MDNTYIFKNKIKKKKKTHKKNKNKNIWVDADAEGGATAIAAGKNKSHKNGTGGGGGNAAAAAAAAVIVPPVNYWEGCAPNRRPIKIFGKRRKYVLNGKIIYKRPKLFRCPPKTKYDKDQNCCLDVIHQKRKKKPTTLLVDGVGTKEKPAVSVPVYDDRGHVSKRKTLVRPVPGRQIIPGQRPDLGPGPGPGPDLGKVIDQGIERKKAIRPTNVPLPKGGGSKSEEQYPKDRDGMHVQRVKQQQRYVSRAAPPLLTTTGQNYMLQLKQEAALQEQQDRLQLEAARVQQAREQNIMNSYFKIFKYPPRTTTSSEYNKIPPFNPRAIYENGLRELAARTRDKETRGEVIRSTVSTRQKHCKG